MIPLARPTIDTEELEAASRVLRSGRLVQGAEVERFEAALAGRCGRRHAIAVSNGTAALFLVLEALGVHDGEVLCPALTWPSPAHAIDAVGARTVLVDVDPDEWNARGAALAAARSESTRGAIVVDQLGNPVRRQEIEQALGGLPIIEDAACAIGSLFEDAPCGSFGLVSCLSFHPRKVITTGEGGACLTDDAALAEELRQRRNHGQRSTGGFARAALNFRLSEMQAAIGTVQLERLDAIVEERRRLARAYEQALPELRFQRAPSGSTANAQTIAAVLPEPATVEVRDRLRKRVAEAGVELGLLSLAVHRLGTIAHDGPLPVTESLADRGVALPAFSGMTSDEQAQVVDTLRRALGVEGLVR